MCGRYALHSHPDVVALQFNLASAPKIEARYNICPSNDILIVREHAQRGRVCDQSHWGLVPSWAKDASIGNRLANARGETIADRPAFKAAFRQWRCLVPASGFYEWKTTRSGKQPYYIRPAGDELFGLAGITELWRGQLRTVCLITTGANELMRGIHDRMPVIVALQDYDAWLDPRNHAAERFIRPYPAQLMRIHPVGQAVSDAANEGAALIEPAVVRGVGAGSRIVAGEHLQGRSQVDPTLFPPRADYLLRVRGMSMRDGGILEGDLLAVQRTQDARSGQIVVARLADEVTVKRLRRRGHAVQLLPENPEFEPIEVDLRRDPLTIEGIAVGVIRNDKNM